MRIGGYTENLLTCYTVLVIILVCHSVVALKSPWLHGEFFYMLYRLGNSSSLPWRGRLEVALRTRFSNAHCLNNHTIKCSGWVVGLGIVHAG